MIVGQLLELSLEAQPDSRNAADSGLLLWSNRMGGQEAGDAGRAEQQQR